MHLLRKTDDGKRFRKEKRSIMDDDDDMNAGSSPVWANDKEHDLEDRTIELSRSERRFLGYAIQAAGMSTCNARHGAVLVKNGNVLAIGVNAMKNDPHVVSPEGPNVLAPSVHVMDMLSVHAEEAVLRANASEAENSVIYIARVGDDGKPTMSKPCKSCQQLLKRYGVKKAIWTLAEAEE